MIEYLTIGIGMAVIYLLINKELYMSKVAFNVIYISLLWPLWIILAIVDKCSNVRD